MYVDKENLFTATAMDLTESSGTEIFADSAINLGAVRDVGKGRPMYVVICMDTALTSTNDTGTIVFAVVDELDADIDTSSVELVQTDPLGVTVLTLGKVIVLPLPAGIMTQQYLGFRAKTGGETIATGTCTVFLALDAQTN